MRKITGGSGGRETEAASVPITQRKEQELKQFFSSKKDNISLVLFFTLLKQSALNTLKICVTKIFSLPDILQISHSSFLGLTMGLKRWI